mgnify:CR=1 FL=1
MYTPSKGNFQPESGVVNISNGFLGRTFDESGKVVNYGIPYMVFYFIAAMIIGVILLHLPHMGGRFMHWEEIRRQPGIQVSIQS